MASNLLALQFLSLFLLFLMNDHDIVDGDMKVELGDQKQVDWYQGTTMSSDEPYTTGHKTSVVHKANQPYIRNYDVVYKANTHEANQPYIRNYDAEYKANTHEVNKPYVRRYDAMYKANTHKANKPYNRGYAAVYKANTYEANKPYIRGYDAMYKTNTHEANKPYIRGYDAVYKANTLEVNKPYIRGYDAVYKANTHKANQHYISPYDAVYKVNTHDAKKAPKESSLGDTSKPYLTQYGGEGPKNDQKESSNVNHTEAFKKGFFTLDDLYVGNVMTLQFPIEEISHFLPKKVAESIPFTNSQLPSVLQLFSIPKDSYNASAMRDTLEQCEANPLKGETKMCATSLESMLEFVSTIIGSEVKYNILTTSYPTTSSVPLQMYTILEVSEDINAPKWVACHPLPYPYAIYYCHFIATGSKIFKVSLGDANRGNQIEALGVCHLDISEWSPDHILFRQLGTKPGQAPICHFFPVKHLMWVPQPSQVTM